ncbi:alpha/beta fold hydrolase [Amycolatopsis umgeniensis]|uniref:Pimeloyl-ACP methyl ester carboxylesterase n=1 Tax=Amycolatopsis umgeniensis TaxID=336628 RepID=A0A841B6J6_9PSEU|nr:alpha/beta hydrolase [Amycolatopsis umgeniensis]MBB5854490.1 pimeloyl-ACP methyl ester carboxylesterase [Amycolatopsis umgeniensis]
MTDDSTPPARPAPPIGGFQEIDGRRLFVHRSGDGGPAVVVLPGASAVGLDYLGIQQEVARFTTAVVYDRGGTGYSDPLPLPRTAAAVATELHALLLAQDVPDPYVLAAHSLGGLYAHRFAQLYPGEVAGLVWLDALHPAWDDFMPASASLAEAERTAPDVEQLDRLRPVLRETYAELRSGYPEHVREALIEAKVSDDWLRAGVAERGGLVELAAELRAGPELPDVPVIALTVVGTDPAQPEQLSRELCDGKTRMDAALVSKVSRGEQRVLTDTLHHRLCFDRPDAVVQAIRDVVDRS